MRRRRACWLLERRSDGDRQSGVPAAVLVRMRSEEGRQGSGRSRELLAARGKRDEGGGGGSREMGCARGSSGAHVVVGGGGALEGNEGEGVGLGLAGGWTGLGIRWACRGGGLGADPVERRGVSWALMQKGRPGRPERLGSSLPLFALIQKQQKNRKKREEKKKAEKEFGHGNKFPGLAKMR